MSFNHRLVGPLDRWTQYGEPITSSSPNENESTIEDSEMKTNSFQRYLPSRKTIYLTLIFTISLVLNGAIKPLYKRGFFCNDLTIYYPIRGDTVNFKVLIVISLIIPGLLIKLCDRRLKKGPSKLQRRDLNAKRRNRKFSDAIPEEDSEDLLSDENTTAEQVIEAPESVQATSEINEVRKESSRRACQRNSSTQTSAVIEPNGEPTNQPRQSNVGAFHHFFVGIIATCFLTGVGKITAARLRPHFMQQCQPKNIDCKLPENFNRYIDDFECLNPEFETYITTSWPSGHASIIFYAMIYLSIFLLRALPRIATLIYGRKVSSLSDPLILFCICTGLVSLAGYVTITRVSDYQHHPTDVLSGCIIGSLVALYWSLSMPVSSSNPLSL